KDFILAGDLGDVIKAGDGDNVVLGDNGIVRSFGGKLLQLLSTETGDDGSLHGGVDTITTGSGNDTVIGGVAGDTIAAGDGHNIVLGDSGEFDFLQGVGTLLAAFSLAPTFGGDDQITTGVGNDVVIGGIGDDTIKAGDGA